MEAVVEDIKKWESVEVERSASEASKTKPDELRMSNATIERYVTAKHDTPYPLEYAYHLLGDVSGKTVLDYGCGMGENSVLIAARGGKSIGIDISPELIDLANKRAEIHGIGDRAEFRVGSAHDLPLENESVDVVFGMAILHHLDLEIAAPEVFRVLKKGGNGIFFEPVRNSRLMWFLRDLVPYEAPDISPYERPLTDSELRQFAKNFSHYESKAFSLPFVNLIEVLCISDKLLHRAIKLDGKILKKFSFLRNYASTRVIRLTR